MFKFARVLTAPFLSLAAFMMSVGFFLTYTSLRLKIEGYDSAIIGYISSGYYLGFLVGAYKVEGFISRLKHIRAFAIFASILTAAIMLQGMFINGWAWFFIRFISGICVSSLFVVIESWFLVVSPDHYRGRILSLYMVAIYSSNAFSQFLIDAFDLTTLMPFLLNGFLCSLAIVPVTMTMTKVPDLSEPAAGMMWKMWKRSPFGVTGCLIGGAMLGCLYTFLPLFAKENGYPIASLMFVAIISGVLFQWPLGWLSDFFDRRIIMLGTSLLIILPSILVYFYTDNYYLVFTSTFLMSGLCFTVYPMGITQACDRLQTVHLTTATGVLLFAYGLGAVLGPLIAPIFISYFAAAGLFVYMACISSFLSLVGIAAIIYAPPVPMEDQQHYIPVPSGYPAPLEEDM